MTATVIETERLIMRPWRESDAEALFLYASDPDVGTPAGWPAHSSVAMSLDVIKYVFSAPETYALVLKHTGVPVGCCGVVPPEARPHAFMRKGDAEIGYWVGKPFWGMGLVPEAVRALIARLRDGLGARDLWIGFCDGNDRSRRVAEKCGFSFDHSEHDGEATEHFYRLAAE